MGRLDIRASGLGRGSGFNADAIVRSLFLAYISECAELKRILSLRTKKQFGTPTTRFPFELWVSCQLTLALTLD